MTKKTLIIIAALLGILLAFIAFENTLSECRPLIEKGLAIRRCSGLLKTTTTDLVMVFLTRIVVIVLIAGGLLFISREREVKLK